MEVPQSGGNASSTYFVLHVWGAPYEQGYAYGTLLAQPLARFLNLTWQYVLSQPEAVLDEYFPAWFSQMVSSFGLDVALDYTIDVQRKYTPQFIFDELQGLCDGAM